MKQMKGYDKMRFLKNILIVLIASFMLTAAPVYAVTLTDVNENEEYFDAINTLTVIGLIKGYEDNTFRPWSTITRAEFTTIAVRALGVDDIKSDNVDNVFNDIKDHYAKYNIKTAYDLGIINGFEDGSFRPDDTVTYEQALKMMVCTLGYGYNAEIAGGYPNGYITLANQLSLSKDINIQYNEPAPRGAIAQLMYNSLNINIQENYYGQYNVTNDTILNSRLNIKKMRIYITGVENEYIDSDYDDLQKGEMSATNMSDSTTMRMTFGKAFENADEVKKYLGQILTVYCRIDEDDDNVLPELISVDTVSDKNTVTEIISKDIESYKNNSLTYKMDSKGRNHSIKIHPTDLTLIYNGKTIQKDSTINGLSIQEQLNEWLDPESEEFINGEIRIIDSGNTSEADVLFITNYEVMFAASSISSSDYKLSDKLVSGNNIILDPNDDDYSVTVTRNGSPSDITSIRTNDVVLIAKSLDEEVYILDVTAKPVTDSISEISEDEIYINGKLYYMTDMCIDYLDSTKNIKVGTQGTFYIDKYNNIIAASITKGASSNYAYLLNIIEDSETGDITASIFVPSISTKNVQRILLKDKVYLNDATVSADSIEDKLADTADLSRDDIAMKDMIYTNKNNQPSANNVAQPVKISVSKNQITNIITLNNGKRDDDDDGNNAMGKNEDEDILKKYLPLSKYKYSSSNNFNDEFYINSSTKILYVPGNRSSKSDYAIYTPSSIFKTSESYWVEPYDVNDKGVASLVLMYGNSTLAEITKDTVMSVLSKNPTLTQVNDENVNKLTMYSSTSTLVTKNTEDDEAFANLKPGDVFQFGYTNNGLATNRKDIIRIDDVLANINDPENNWYDNKFNYYYTELGDVVIDNETDKPYSRVMVANVAQITRTDDEDESSNAYIRITQDGFDGDVLSTDNALRYEVTSKTPVVRYNISKETVSAYIEGTTSKYDISDLKDAENNGTDCSKILIYLLKDKVKFIMIYE